jgi:hypothetical protein
MPKRTIKTALATYRAADGTPGAFGFRGEEVDVHADDVARFDELNVEPSSDEVEEAKPSLGANLPDYEKPGNEWTSPAAENSGNGSGLNTVVSDEDVAESTADDDAKEAKPRRRSNK